MRLRRRRATEHPTATAAAGPTRCTECGTGTLTYAGSDRDARTSECHTLACSRCGADFPTIDGAPFIGRFEQGDILGLLEIAANARDETNRSSADEIERIERLLQLCYEADDKASFRQQCADAFARAPWFENRYGEFAAFRRLTSRIDLRSRLVLDVGAGAGYDAARLVAAGASVTALEYNPVLIRHGRAAVPEARWVGGFSHALPFHNATFDVVFCNAALHHMRDVPAAMREMLRVLRRGGHLLTIGDPFRPDGSGEDLEFSVFDEHPAVLLGVNETIPRFSDLVRALEENESRLAISLLVMDLHAGSPPRRRFHRRASDVWRFAERRWLRDASGSIAIKARIRRPVALEGTTQSTGVLAPDEYAEWLDDPEAVLQRLLPHIPTECFDRDFPGEDQTRFELLNGWRKPHESGTFRTGYKRARWFLKRPSFSADLAFRIRRSAQAELPVTLQVTVSGRRVSTCLLGGDWGHIVVPLARIGRNERFVCELEVESPDGCAPTFHDLCFDVADRSFV